MGHLGDVRSGGAVLAEGLIAGTQIATMGGWRSVESLAAGDAVQTFAAGAQRIRAVSRAMTGRAAIPQVLWPVVVPAGALDNREELVLLPDQRVLLVTDVAEDQFGERFVLVPAAALDGWRGIRRRRSRADTAVVRISFETPQILYASRATLVSCPGETPVTPDCAMLPLPEAEHLVACLMAEDLGVALWGQAKPAPRRWF
ncbi:MAG: hypothetical protein DI533_08930 [Cereibacter sphaeroides]|uniref:Hedgehog/Intein (Hint) domain-containing protein n=1 Tax=Cereibacter sphaeroides TaxID=1063 RepID=A0A2W5TWY5_CERSP|nr:MAG: hypothetical protein DI533_08930 [Cereibacter sphaeroides]